MASVTRTQRKSLTSTPKLPAIQTSTSPRMVPSSTTPIPPGNEDEINHEWTVSAFLADVKSRGALGSALVQASRGANYSPTSPEHSDSYRKGIRRGSSGSVSMLSPGRLKHLSHNEALIEVQTFSQRQKSLQKSHRKLISPPPTHPSKDIHSKLIQRLKIIGSPKSTATLKPDARRRILAEAAIDELIAKSNSSLGDLLKHIREEFKSFYETARLHSMNFGSATSENESSDDEDEVTFGDQISQKHIESLQENIKAIKETILTKKEMLNDTLQASALVVTPSTDMMEGEAFALLGERGKQTLSSNSCQQVMQLQLEIVKLTSEIKEIENFRRSPACVPDKLVVECNEMISVAEKELKTIDLQLHFVNESLNKPDMTDKPSMFDKLVAEETSMKLLEFGELIEAAKATI